MPRPGRQRDIRAAILALVLATGPAPAVAKPVLLRSTVVGSGSLLLGSDGTRYAAWVGGGVAATRVYDAATATTTRIAPPAGCAATAIGAGALLATCDAGPLLSSAQVLNLRTRMWRPVVAPMQESGFTPYRSFVGIGARWISATVQDYHSRGSLFYSRASGELYAGRSPYGLHVRPDLDRAALRTRLCAPLVARPSDDPDNADRRPPQVDGRFALDSLTNGMQATLVLRQCATRRHRVVCKPWCFSPVLDRGQVLWADDLGRLHVLDVRSGRGGTYVLPRHSVRAIDPLGPELIVGTDALSRTAPLQVRVIRRPDPARGRRRR